ncbi:MAG: hypothetical protein CMI32_02720 [Opitutales bacterium]|nr:hypothetical protein [Opitutales bacterium]|tara:strand:+ start:1957 stop:4914 length:2958 start_codon:yes stop_codon:yes gene_type:complete
MKFTLCILCLVPALSLMGATGEIDFNRDVRPILADKCFACHGPAEEGRKAKLRLDDRAVAVKKEAIVPGKPDESELVFRIFSDDPDEVMPTPKSKATLTAGQKEILRKWIAEGAEYSMHWAFVPPKRAPAPAVKETSWPRNGIDSFILADLESNGLKPSPEADRHTLIRRVYLDLIGLPPTPEETDSYLNDKDPKAYDNLVDRLLKSPRYGERWARNWLDLARYADTNGYEKDRARAIWPYRDWVIKALNEDMPFDQFTIEQIAGDMLPNPTPSQIVATGFHRNTMLNEEGGIDPLEFRFHAMVDRVATTGAVWMGLATGCGQCHSHKYDPFTQTDYYRLMALLNNADEPDYLIPDPKTLARRKVVEEKITKAESVLEKETPDFEEKFSKWLNKQRAVVIKWQILRPTLMKTNLPRLEVLEDGSLFSTGDITKRDEFTLRFRCESPVTALRLEVMPDDRLPAGGPGRCYYEGRKGDFFLSEVTGKANGKTIKFVHPSHGFGKISIGSGKAHAANVLDGEGSTGWSTSGREGKSSQLVLPLETPLPAGTELEIGMLFERHFAASLGRFRFAATSAKEQAKAKQMPTAIEDLLVKGEGDLEAGQRDKLRRHFLFTAPEFAAARKPVDALRKGLPKLPVTMVMRERPADNPRPTHRHHRGEYLSPKEEVTPGVPATFPPLPKGEPANRLTFAKWLVSESNSLGGRVTVNRAWRAFFGAGLLRTSGDFGTQSEAPDHPELLDWMAVEFREQGMSLKKLHRLIVTSATYRQDSRVTPELLARDPFNRLLARGPRHRLDAEVIRDLMLKSSGKLSVKMYGPSVYPPQPASVTAVAYGATKWNVSRGEDRYRRSLYTFSKRTAPFAGFATFDAPSGEGCVARRNRSNTPLQALTLLNDDMFVELAWHLAAEAEKMAAEKRIEFLFRKFLVRPPMADETTLMSQFLETQRQRLAKGELKASIILGRKNASNELAALALLTRAIMNLDETVSKQ